MKPSSLESINEKTRIARQNQEAFIVKAAQAVEKKKLLQSLSKRQALSAGSINILAMFISAPIATLLFHTDLATAGIVSIITTTVLDIYRADKRANRLSQLN